MILVVNRICGAVGDGVGGVGSDWLHRRYLYLNLEKRKLGGKRERGGDCLIYKI